MHLICGISAARNCGHILGLFPCSQCFLTASPISLMLLVPTYPPTTRLQPLPSTHVPSQVPLAPAFPWSWIQVQMPFPRVAALPCVFQKGFCSGFVVQQEWSQLVPRETPQPGEGPTPQQGDLSCRSCGHGEPRREQVVPEGLQPGEGPMLQLSSLLHATDNFVC